MRTPKNLVRHELIGLEVRIADSSGKKTEEVNGKVIDETRNTLTVEVEGKEKKFIKENCVFSFFLPETKERVKVEGSVIVGRPEDRIKKKIKTW